MDQQIIAPYEKKYFTMLPNIVDDDASLDTYQFRLLVHYYRVGNCWESVRTTAEKCNMGIGKVSEVRRELAGLGWITLSERENGVIITVVDKWRENMEACSPHEHETQESVLHTNTKCSPHELKNTNTKNNQNNAHVREETDVRQEMGWQQLQAAIAKVMVRDLFLFDEETNKLVDALYGHYTPDQILRYYGQGGYWRRHDWRGSKSPQAPTVAHIKETIGDCKRFDENPEAFAPSKPKVTSEDVDAAFQQLSLICRRYGRNRFRDAKPELEKHGLDKVVDKLGWQNVCLTPADKLIWSFRSAYREQPVPA